MNRLILKKNENLISNLSVAEMIFISYIFLQQKVMAQSEFDTIVMECSGKSHIADSSRGERREVIEIFGGL